MRGLVALVLVLAVLWCGYWFVGARAVTDQAERLFTQAQARGMEATRDDLVVRGFPNRFDLTVEGLRLADPATGFGWEAPFVQVFALTYRPWHLIAAFPPEQVFRTPAGTMTLTAAKLQASLRARPQTALPLERTTLVGTGLGLVAGRFGTLAADELRVATRDRDGTGLTHELGLEITNLAPDPALMARLGAAAPVIDRLSLDADLSFDAPIDRRAARSPPDLTAVRLREALAVWGEVTAHASGTLLPDGDGLAEGSLDLRLTNWRPLVPMAVTAGLIRPDAAPGIERMLGLMALQSGDAETLSLTLGFSGGTVNLGPMALAPAPRLR